MRTKWLNLDKEGKIVRLDRGSVWLVFIEGICGQIVSSIPVVLVDVYELNDWKVWKFMETKTYLLEKLEICK